MKIYQNKHILKYFYYNIQCNRMVLRNTTLNTWNLIAHKIYIKVMQCHGWHGCGSGEIKFLGKLVSVDF